MAELAAAAAARRVAGSSQALLVVDDDGICVEASLGACRLLGAARSEVVGRDLEQLLEDESRERWHHVWEAFRKSGGHAEPFALEAPATLVEVGLTVTAEIVEGRHLVSLDAIRATEPALPSDADTPTRARTPTAREIEVLTLLAAGATDGQIATELELSPATVQTHVRNAKAKLGARTRAQAVAMALRAHLINGE